MTKRLIVVLPFLLLFSLAAVAQSGEASPAAPGNAAVVMSLHGLSEGSYSLLPADPRFVMATDEKGESSSRTHSHYGSSSGSRIGESPSSAGPLPCEKPAKLFSAREYSGPLERFTARFTRRPEMTTVPTHVRDGNDICGLDIGQKFRLFYKTTLDPVTFIGAAASAGFSQWNNDDKEWGQGAEGYGKRYGAAYVDRAQRNFFGQFFYPAIFQQDPRFYRLGTGTVKERLEHAVAHTFVARRDDGARMPNLSHWAATVSVQSLANLYHPDNDRGFGSTATRVGVSFGVNMGWDVAKEFWPEIVRGLHLPFKERTVVSSGTP
ncbi:MAG TPA: hypothetical protein VE783_13685 [Candidatus Limnocylindrales bacterium]|nr:hypothetical protein [Candidatus Limnocylindrales bacterium]